MLARLAFKRNDDRNGAILRDLQFGRTDPHCTAALACQLHCLAAQPISDAGAAAQCTGYRQFTGPDRVGEGQDFASAPFCARWRRRLGRSGFLT